MEIADYIVAEDRELVDRVLKGDNDAFEYLFNRYRDAIHRLFVQRLGGVNDADDLLQETFIKVYINLHRYSADYTFGQWVYTIARNTFIDFVRRRQDDLPIDERFAAPASNAPTPEESVINLQQRSQIEHYLEHLAPRYRQLILHALFRGVLLRGDRGEALAAARDRENPDTPRPRTDVPAHRPGRRAMNDSRFTIHNSQLELIIKYFPDLTGRQKEQFAALYDLYADWNAKINVVSRKDFDQLYLRHVLHSLAIAKVCTFGDGARILDVGCGGGFPSVPLAILFPEACFTAADSIRKKITVVEGVAAGLGLTNLTPRCVRVETLTERFDYVVSRAVTAMPEFVGWIWNRLEKGQKGSLPNGILYLKGGDLAEELALTGKRWHIYDIPRIFRRGVLRNQEGGLYPEVGLDSQPVFRILFRAGRKLLPAAVIVRTSVGRAFVPKPLRLLLVRLLPGDDRAEVVHEGLGVGRALDASQQFAPGVEHEVERNGAAAVLLHQFAARGLVRVVFGRHEPLVHELPDVLARKDLPLHHPARGTPAGIEVDEDQLAPALIAISRTASVDLVSNFTCACAAPVPSANVSKKSSFFIRIEFSGDGRTKTEPAV